MIWIVILALVLIVTIIGIVFMVNEIQKFTFIKKIAKESKSKTIIISLIIIFIFFIITSFLISLVNALIIFIHILFAFLIYELVFKVIELVFKKKISFNYLGLLSIITSVIYLSIGFYLCNNVWQTTYKLNTNKNIGSLKIAMFSDSHVGATFDGEGFEKHVNRIKKQNPDIVFIPGDYVDDGSKKVDMIKACKALGSINSKYGVFFSFGNHDKGYYNSRDFSEEDLINELKKNNVNVLTDDIKTIDNITIIGRLDSTYKNRKSIKELTKNIDNSKYTIVLDHEPNDYKNEEKENIDLVLSGHTHGGQLFPITHLGNIIGINDKTYGYERRNNTDFIVSSGISDWELKFKTGTKSEYVIINVTEK